VDGAGVLSRRVADPHALQLMQQAYTFAVGI